MGVPLTNGMYSNSEASEFNLQASEWHCSGCSNNSVLNYDASEHSMIADHWELAPGH